MTRTFGIVLTVCLLTGAAATADAAGGQAPGDVKHKHEKRRSAVVTWQRDGVKIRNRLVGVDLNADGERVRYWIGVNCSPVDDALRAHVELPDQQGLLIDSIVDDSPAAKAGLEQYDILISANDRPLNAVGDLVEAVEAAGKDETAVTLRVLRGGKKQSIEVKPAARPAVPNALRVLNIADLELDVVAQDDFDFHVVRPLVAQGSRAAWRLPKNVRIRVEKEGDKPAAIVVVKDGKTWEVTEDNLDKLPEDVRPHVREMLGSGAGDGEADIEFHVQPRLDVWRGWFEDFAGEADSKLPVQPRPRSERSDELNEQRPADGDLRKRLQHLEERIKRLEQRQQREKPTDE